MSETTLILLPGLDGTYPPSGPNGYDDLLPLVQRAVAATPRFHILGRSFGGPLALMTAGANPEAVRGIILCASFARAPRPDLVPWRFAFRPPVVATIRALRRAPALVRGYSTEGMRRGRAETWRRVGSGVLSSRTRAALAVDARPYLASCSAPVLYVASSHDRVVPRRNIDDVRAAARSCEVVTIEGPHLALVTNPSAAAAHIADFIRRTA